MLNGLGDTCEYALHLLQTSNYGSEWREVALMMVLFADETRELSELYDYCYEIQRTQLSRKELEWMTSCFQLLADEGLTTRLPPLHFDWWGLCSCCR